MENSGNKNTRKRKRLYIGKQTVLEKCARLSSEKRLLSIPEYEPELNHTESIKECLTSKKVKVDKAGKQKLSAILERNDSGYATDEGDDEIDESDVIVPNDINISSEPKPPKIISNRSTWTRLSGDSPVEDHLFKFGDLKPHSKVFGLIEKKPGKYEKTPLRIKHEYEDTEQGDEFGAKLQTYENEFKGALIRQHFLVDIESRGPADKMRIKNNDELICVNGIFVPEKTHHEVVDIFHHAKVDGKTRFHLVIRRAIHYANDRGGSNSKPQKKWQWIEISAILAPDLRQILDKQPAVLDVESMPLPSDKYTTYAHTSYFTKNRHLFIDITEHGLVADVNKSTSGDKTKILLRSGRVTANRDGHLVMHAALSDLERKRYIIVVNNRVTLGSHPCWFEYWSSSVEVNFKKDDKYLACDESTGQMNFISTEFAFVEVGKNHGHDFVDSGGQAATGFSTAHPLKATCETENGSLQQGGYCPLTTGDTIDGHIDRNFSIARAYSLRSCSYNGSSAMEID